MRPHLLLAPKGEAINRRGVFHKTTEPGQAHLVWGEPRDSLTLVAEDKGRIADATPVKWVVAPQFVQLSRAAQGHPNEVACRIDSIRVLGAVSTVHCVPLQGPRKLLHVEVTTSQLRELKVFVGDTVQVRLEPQGIHVMPLKRSATARAGPLATGPSRADSSIDPGRG